MLKKITKLFESAGFWYLIVFSIFVLGFAARLYKVGNPIADWHSWRQADTASVTRFFVTDGIDLLRPRYHDISSIQTGIFNPNGYRMVELPIYNALHSILFQTFGYFSLEVWGRVLTALIATATAFFVFQIGKSLFGKWGAVLSLFFYLFTPFNIYFTRVILPDPLGVLFAVVSLWSFLNFTEKNKEIYFYLSAFAMALTLLIKPYFGFYLIPIFYLAVSKFGFRNILNDKRLRNKVVVYFAVSVIPFLMYRYWEAKFPEGIPFYKWAFNGNGIRFKPSFWYWIFGQRLSHLILGGLGIIPFVFGLLDIRLKNRLVQYMLLGAFVYVALVANANVMHDYYQIPLIPIISITLAGGVLYLWNSSTFNKTLTRIISVVSVFVMLITGWSLIKENYNVNHPEIIEAGNEIASITSKDDLILAPYNGDTALLYQTGRSGWPAVDDSIDNIISKGADYYLSVDLGSPDTKLIESRFKTIKKTNKYIIIDLKQPLIKQK